MKMIEVSDTVYMTLQKIAQPFVDTPNDVIERLMQTGGTDLIGSSQSRARNNKTITSQVTRLNGTLSHKERGRQTRSKYVDELRQQGIELNHMGKIFYQSSNKIWIAIPTATERISGKWFLGMADSFFKERDGLNVILLCSKDDEVLDFYLPDLILKKIAPKLTRDKHDQLKFNISERNSNQYDLLLSGESPIEITEFLHAASEYLLPIEKNEQTITVENYSAISFRFVINKSFLNTGNHPITIPKNLYNELREQNILSILDTDCSKREVTVEGITGVKVSGWIYFGIAGGGYPYYQIQLSSRQVPSDFCNSFKIGDKIKIYIDKHDDSGILISLKRIESSIASSDIGDVKSLFTKINTRA